MILSVLIWLLQDIIQVVFMGIFLVPELFLLSLVFAGLRPENEHRHSLSWYIAAGFVGGLLWDLRWTNLPGLTAALNGALLALVFVVWHLIPAQGRNTKSFIACALAVQILSAAVHAMFWTVTSMTTLRLFAIQQLIGVAFIMLLGLVHKKAIYRHV